MFAMRFAIALSMMLAAAAPAADDDLVGLWGAETIFGPQVRGELTLERSATAWTLRAGGFEVSAPVSGDDFHLALPAGLGELRGRVPHAFWVQPRGNLGQFATPVTLRPAGANAWRGVIDPLDDRFSLYLDIRRGDDGALRGSFHNPEVNWTGRAAWFRVERGEESIKLIDPKTGKQRFVQPYDARQRTIAMDFGAPIALTPRTRETAVGFIPRLTAVRYRAPLDLGDGWPVARARDEGLDEAMLQQLVERITGVDPSDPNAPRVHSIQIARHGKLVLDEYFFGFTPERTHDLRSASKSLTSLMVGIAGIRVDTPIDPAHANITIGHLLTHSSGLACDDNDDASPGNEDTMQAQTKQNDWYRFFLDLPAAREPGTTYAYCTAGINYAAGMVAKKSGAWLPEFFDRTVARPMQIRDYHVNLMPDGQAYGGGGIYMRPRDLLKFGETFLRGGVWKGTRIVSKQWVTASTSPQIRNSSGDWDGYGWHRSTLRFGDRTFEEYEANGNGGQFLIVVPALDVAVVFTAGNYGQYQVWGKFRSELVPRYVLAPVRDIPTRPPASK